MALKKDEIKQFEQIIGKVIVEKVPKLIRYEVQPMFDKQKKEIILDARILIQQEIRSIKEDLQLIKRILKQFKKMETEDVEVVYDDNDFLKEKVKELENRIKTLELSQI